MPQPNEVSAQKPYLADSLDYNRVQERASHGYFRTFWSAYKGHVRGMLAGVVIGGMLGAAVGLAVLYAASVAGGAILSAGAAELAMASFAGIGGMLGATAYGDAGSAAASRAAGLAERHARVLDPANNGIELKALDDRLMMDGRRHHFQFPENRDKGKLFNWKSGLVGASVGAALGAALATTGFVAKMALFKAYVVAGSTSMVAPALAALAFGALGATYGIDRSNLKAIFNQVDSNSWGKLHDGTPSPDLGKAQYAGREGDAQLTQHRLNRQESTSILEDEYHSKIFASSVKGMFRGFAGGVVAGALIGAAVGAAAFGVAALAAPSIVGLAGIVDLGIGVAITSFAGAGALFGMKVFADAGREAGAESTARAIDNEFERNQELRERGITPPKPGYREERNFNLKAALLMGAIGVAVATLATGMITSLPAIEIAGLSLTAQSVAGVIGGLFGAMYGVGSDTLGKINKLTDKLYAKTYLADNQHADPYVATSQTVGNPSPQTPAVTSDDVSLIQERMGQRPQKTFEQAVLAQQPNTQTVRI